MISIHLGPTRARALLLPEAERLELLARDLRLIAASAGPTPSDLDQAPVISSWRFTSRSIASMVGVVDGHPRLPDGPVNTTEIWAWDLERRWARTLSRYYVLGSREGDRNNGE